MSAIFDSGEAARLRSGSEEGEQLTKWRRNKQDTFSAFRRSKHLHKNRKDGIFRNPDDLRIIVRKFIKVAAEAAAADGMNDSSRKEGAS